MPNPYDAPEISAREVDQMRRDAKTFVWLDVREPWEVAKVHVNDESVINVPMNVIAERRLDALPEATLDKNATLVVQCHHGARSAQVTQWLRQQGWTNAVSLGGGVEAWAKDVDPSIGRY